MTRGFADANDGEKTLSSGEDMLTAVVIDHESSPYERRLPDPSFLRQAIRNASHKPRAPSAKARQSDSVHFVPIIHRDFCVPRNNTVLGKIPLQSTTSGSADVCLLPPFVFNSKSAKQYKTKFSMKKGSPLTISIRTRRGALLVLVER